MFEVYDTDGDGKLLKDELATSLRKEFSIITHGIEPDRGSVPLDIDMT